MEDFFYDLSLSAFPRLDGEADDAPRFQRAVNACSDGVLFVPRGDYHIAQTVRIENCCSLLMHKSARLEAVCPMDYVLFYNGGSRYEESFVRENGRPFDDYNLFISGGAIDGRGLASCLCVNGCHHFTLRDITLLNGLKYGLRVGEVSHGYELIAANVYCKCTVSGLAGNAGMSINDGDSHYTDCVVVDYTRGIEITGGGSNRLTRCHVWGGPIPPVREGALPEMLENSICFDIGGNDTVLRDCYADTGAVGFNVKGDTRLLGCAYFSNRVFKLDDAVVINHEKGFLVVSDCRFAKTMEHLTLYKGSNENVLWRDNQNTAGLQYPWEE